MNEIEEVDEYQEAAYWECCNCGNRLQYRELTLDPSICRCGSPKSLMIQVYQSKG